MSAIQKCPKCGAAHAGAAFEGLCPACMVTVMRQIPAPVMVTEKAGDRIGNYKLLEQLGEGGCGVVYMAEQEEPVRRKVALKVIKLGMDTQQVVARFEAERQALAMMDHPNIAKVFDAGATDAGRPFFVMELVRGIRITDYCDQNQLSTTERLDLFIQVCQAIQHAHQKGIIHRDIKPSNILVAQHDTVAVPKVIDFGIAKATSDQRLTDKTLFTAFQQFMGTPAYMSPEQAHLSGLDIDTRTDIYSLGVLLYELLTGQTPFDARELLASGIDAMRKTICEKEPARPSTRLRQTLLASMPSSKLTTNHCSLATDLDWIVMKCLEKDRSRRYETANGLAADLKRHLGNEPVVARPPSTAYRIGKLVRRNKLAFVAAVAVTAVLVLGTLVSTWQALEAGRARDAAKQERGRAESGERIARQKGYASDMSLANQAVALNNLGRAQDLLDRHRPPSGQQDLRGWEWRYLWQQCQSEALLTLCKKSNGICSLALSPDGKWLAVGEEKEGRLSIWDLEKREEILPSSADEGPVFAVFSPRERLLAFSSGALLPTVNRQCRVRFWDGGTKRIFPELRLDDSCRGLAFSGDGDTLASITAGAEGQLLRWKIPEGIELPRHDAGKLRYGLGSPFAVTRELSVAAYAVFRDGIRVVDLRTGEEQWKHTPVPPLDEYVITLALSPNGRILASGGGFAPSPVRLLDAASGTPIRDLEGHSGYVCSLVFWPDGETLAAGCSDQTIRVWKINGGPPLRTLVGHKAAVWSLALLPDNKTLVSGCRDGSVCVWDTEASGRASPPVRLPGTFVGWSFAADGQTVLTCDERGRVAQWQGSYLSEEPLFEMRMKISAATFLPHRSMLVVAGAGGGDQDGTATQWANHSRIQVWDLKTRRPLPELTLSGSPSQLWFCLARGNRLIIGDAASQRLHEWDLITWKKKDQVWPAPAQLYSGALSPDGRWCVTLGFGGASTITDLTTGHMRTANFDVSQHSGATFSADGTRLAVVSIRGSRGIWNAATLQRVGTFQGSQGGDNAAAFSPDGQRLATCGLEKETLTLWDVESHEELLVLGGNGSRLSPPAFSPDGAVLGSMNVNGVLHLWRAPSWAEIEAAEKEGR